MRKYLVMQYTYENRQDIKIIVGCLLDINGLASKKQKALNFYLSGNYEWKEYREWISKELDELDDLLKEAYDRNERVDRIKTTYKDWLDISWKHTTDIAEWKRRKYYNKKYNKNKDKIKERAIVRYHANKEKKEREFRYKLEQSKK